MANQSELLRLPSGRILNMALVTHMDPAPDGDTPRMVVYFGAGNVMVKDADLAALDNWLEYNTTAIHTYHDPDPADSIDEATAMFNQHQQMKEAMQ